MLFAPSVTGIRKHTIIFTARRQRRCWVHKTANILDKMPKSVQGRAQRVDPRNVSVANPQSRCRLQLNRDRQKPGGLLTVVAMQCLAGEWRKKAKLEFTITVNWPSRRRHHRDDAVGDPGPRRLPLGRRCGFATRGRQANSRAATRDCGQRTAAAILRSCAALSPLSSSAPLKGLSASAFRYGVWEARCARPTF